MITPQRMVFRVPIRSQQKTAPRQGRGGEDGGERPGTWPDDSLDSLQLSLRLSAFSRLRSFRTRQKDPSFAPKLGRPAPGLFSLQATCPLKKLIRVLATADRKSRGPEEPRLGSGRWARRASRSSSSSSRTSLALGGRWGSCWRWVFGCPKCPNLRCV